MKMIKQINLKRNLKYHQYTKDNLFEYEITNKQYIYR